MSAYINHPGVPPRLIPDFEPVLTARQAQVLHIVRSYGGNRSRAARHLGVNVSVVQKALHYCTKAGARVPPVITRRGIPNGTRLALSPRCAYVLPRHGEPCGRRLDHPGCHVGVRAWTKPEPQPSRFR